MFAAVRSGVSGRIPVDGKDIVVLDTFPVMKVSDWKVVFCWIPGRRILGMSDIKLCDSRE